MIVYKGYFNAYYDDVVGFTKNFSSVRPSLSFGIDNSGANPIGANIFIDQGNNDEVQVFDDYWQNNTMRGIKLLVNGNVGICEVNPASRFVVRGVGNDDQTSAFNVVNSDGTSSLFVQDDGNVGIGEVNPASRFVVSGAGNDDQTSAFDVVNSDGTSLLFVRDDGKIIIGEESITSGDHTDFILSVDGKIVTEEIVITLDDWSDFVFNDSYNLMPLNQLENSIKKNKHLPGIPSSEEVIKNGIELGEMQAKLLQKIEELTLYIIQLQKEINLQKE